MKKSNGTRRLIQKSRQVSNLKRSKRKANLRKHKRAIFFKFRKALESIRRFEVGRRQFRKNFYTRSYKGDRIIIPISGEFGLEKPESVDSFLEMSSKIVDFNSKELIFDLRKCTRIWPSGITLLCSLMQWVELTTRNERKVPKLASIASEDAKVNSYLYHCGFNDYVKLQKIEDTSYYLNDDVVKIRRELNQSNIEMREDEILDLLQKHSLLDKEGIEWFNSVILTEVFNNVTEHGISHKDKGWWLLAQYHKTHGFISMCVADNGIGIRNSLMTGPQGAEIKKSIRSADADNDGVYIRHAMKENVSGAITASVKDGSILVWNKYSEGSRRGNGLDRIYSTCKRLNLEFSILSQHGYLMFDEFANEVKCGYNTERVFAGTLYHFKIPAIKG
jgi:hypothetical protein